MKTNQTIYSNSSINDLKHISEASVANPRDVADGKKWHSVKAKWDTGATTCVISRRMAEELELNPQHHIKCTTFAGVTQMGFDMVAVSLEHNGLYTNILAGMVDAMPHADCDLLIGMNLIVRGVLQMGASPECGELWLSFEPKGPDWKPVPRN